MTNPKELQKILKEVQHKCFIRDLKRAGYTKEKAEKIIKVLIIKKEMMQ